MSKYILQFILLSLYLLKINCIYKGERLTLQEQFEIEDLANEIIKKNGEFIMKLKNVDIVIM